ncbi:MAG: hypothetical protein KF884_03210 [Fimbriimonadaceae bacterium]|nr:hypothetical protein [Fimbriimonadaceae bacterium]QYK59103.1 MAG: hypothetical protein KF884_03210 [Fimbriimonadaceae bacterium]
MSHDPRRPSPKSSWKAFVWIVLVPLGVMFVAIGAYLVVYVLREGV